MITKKKDSIFVFVWISLGYLVFCNILPSLAAGVLARSLPGSLNAYYTGLCCVTGVVFINRLYAGFGEKTKLGKNISMAGILEALGIGLFLFLFVNFLVSPLLGIIFQESQTNYSQSVEMMFQTPYSTFFQLVFLAPVMEEMIFRGFLLRRALRWRSIAVSVLLVAGFFGLLHLSVVQGLSAMAAGVILCLLFVWKRSVALCIICHGFYNGLAFFMVLASRGGAA